MRVSGCAECERHHCNLERTCRPRVVSVHPGAEHQLQTDKQIHNTAFDLTRVSLQDVATLKDPCKASFRKLNLLTLENINRYQILLFMFRYHHNLLPKSFTIFFQTGIQIHSHYTRFSHYYRSHYARIRTKEFSIHCTGPLLWNGLPEELKTLPLLNSFKYQLKQLLVNN